MTVSKSAVGFTASGFGSVLCTAVRYIFELTIVCFHFIVVQLPHMETLSQFQMSFGAKFQCLELCSGANLFPQLLPET